MAPRVHTHGAQCTRWHDREPFSSRIQSPAWQAAGYEVLLCKAAGYIMARHGELKVRDHGFDCVLSLSLLPQREIVPQAIEKPSCIDFGYDTKLQSITKMDMTKTFEPQTETPFLSALHLQHVYVRGEWAVGCRNVFCGKCRNETLLLCSG